MTKNDERTLFTSRTYKFFLIRIPDREIGADSPKDMPGLTIKTIALKNSESKCPHCDMLKKIENGNPQNAGNEILSKRKV